MRKVLLYLTIALSIITVVLYVQLDKTKIEKKRLSNNQEALLSDVEHYKTENGRNVASVQKLELTKKELVKHNAELVNTVSDLNIKINRLESASTTAFESEYKIKTVIRDSIVYRDLAPIRVSAINYKSPYIDLSGIIERGKFDGAITTRDTLVQVVHRVPKKFLFIKYGTKGIRQEVLNKNPHSKITYSEYLEFKK